MRDIDRCRAVGVIGQVGIGDTEPANHNDVVCAHRNIRWNNERYVRLLNGARAGNSRNRLGVAKTAAVRNGVGAEEKLARGRKARVG